MLTFEHLVFLDEFPTWPKKIICYLIERLDLNGIKLHKKAKKNKKF